MGVGTSRTTRRQLLGALATGASVAAAGCSRVEAFYADGGDGGDGGDDEEQRDETDDGETPRPVDGVDLDRWTDVRYRETDAADLHLDVTRAADDVARPLLVHVHGGGWRRGSKGYDHAERFARAGHVVASVEYRLSEQARFPAAVRDVAAAVDWLREHADGYGIDPERVAVVGESAGGHLSALLASAPDEAEFRPTGVDADALRAIDAVVGVSGIYDLRLEDYCTAPATEAFIGGTCEARPDDARLASPVVHVDGDHPPTLLYHGTADDVVAFEHATTYRDALREHGVDVELFAAEGGGHLLETDVDAFLARQEAFLAERVGLASA